MIETIVVATDGSDQASKAVGFAADLAQRYEAKLIVVTVMKGLAPEDVPKSYREFARAEHIKGSDRDVLESIGNQILRDAEVLAEEHKAPDIETQLEVGDPASTILSVARNQGADAIVMGSRGLGEITGLLLGSVSHKVSHLCECTCVIVKGS